MTVSNSQAIHPRHIIAQYLDTNGDGTGAKNAIGNYSDATGSGVENFFYESKGYCHIHRMIVAIEDNTNMWASRYGGGPTLTNGILVKVIDADGLTEIKDLTNFVPIKTNARWGALCYDVDLKTWGTGNELLLARWSFDRAGSPIRLEPGMSLRVILNDDFSILNDHRFMVQGEIRP